VSVVSCVSLHCAGNNSESTLNTAGKPVDPLLSRFWRYVDFCIGLHGRGVKFGAVTLGRELTFSSKIADATYVGEFDFDGPALQEKAARGEDPWVNQVLRKRPPGKGSDSLMPQSLQNSSLGPVLLAQESHTPSFTNVIISKLRPRPVSLLVDPKEQRSMAMSLAHTYHHYLMGPYGQTFLHKTSDGKIVPHMVRLPWHAVQSEHDSFHDAAAPAARFSRTSHLEPRRAAGGLGLSGGPLPHPSSDWPLTSIVLEFRGFGQSGDSVESYNLQQLWCVANGAQYCPDPIKAHAELAPAGLGLNGAAAALAAPADFGAVPMTPSAVPTDASLNALLASATLAPAISSSAAPTAASSSNSSTIVHPPLHLPVDADDVPDIFYFSIQLEDPSYAPIEGEVRYFPSTVHLENTRPSVMKEDPAAAAAAAATTAAGASRRRVRKSQQSDALHSTVKGQ
jgi:hypothetical protein